MNLEHLRYIIAVTKNGFNITKTAENLFISQPSLSQAIQKFEFNIGYNIFVRNNGRLIGLTESGKTVVSEGKILLENFDNFSNQIKSLYHTKNRIKIGISTPLLEILFEDTIKTIIEEFGLDKIQIIEDTNSNLEKMFINKSIHILFTLKENNLAKSDSFSTEIINQRYKVIMDKSNELANKKSLSWKDLENQTIIIPSEGYVTEKIVRVNLEKNRVKPKRIYNIVSVKVIEKLIKNSNSLSVLPKIFLEKNSELAFIDLKNPISWTVEMLIHIDFFDKDNFIYSQYIEILKVLLKHFVDI